MSHDQLNEQAILISAIAHELRNPLRAAGHFAELARRSSDKGKKQNTHSPDVLKAIDDNTSKAIVAITQAYQRLESISRVGMSIAQRQASKEPGFALDALRSVLDDVSEQIDEHSIHVDIAPSLYGDTGKVLHPTPYYSEHAELPPVALGQESLLIVFRNIIDNAIKYHDPLKLERTLDIRYLVGVDVVSFWFDDNGLGLPKSVDPQSIFELFNRAHAHHDGPAGDGIGLALTRLLLRQAGGMIRCIRIDDGDDIVMFLSIPIHKD